MGLVLLRGFAGGGGGAAAGLIDLHDDRAGVGDRLGVAETQRGDITFGGTRLQGQALDLVTPGDYVDLHRHVISLLGANGRGQQDQAGKADNIKSHWRTTSGMRQF